MSDIDILKTELTTDPLTRGYSGMSDQAAADDMNTEYRTDTVTELKASDIWNAVDLTEYDALSAENKAIMDLISGMDDGITVGGGLIKDKVFAMFDGGSVTRASIIALTAPPISRGVEIGFGVVKAGNIEEARR